MDATIVACRSVNRNAWPLIPTTLTGLLILLFLLVPGFLFVTLRERHRPTRKLSVFRETGTVLTATVVSYLVPALATVLLAMCNLDFRAGFAAFLGSPTAYVEAHPFRLALIGGSWVVVGSVIAAFVLSTRWMSRFIPSNGGSAWWELFDVSHLGLVDIEVSVTLHDDTVLTGVLHSWSRDGDDHADRALVLRAPLWIQPSDAKKPVSLSAATLSVNEREIKFVSVRYLEQTA